MNEEVLQRISGFNGDQDLIPADNEDKNEKKQRSGRKAWLVAGAAVVLLLLAIGILPRLRRSAELTVAAKEVSDSVPTVSVVLAKKPPETSELLLPGTTQAIQETVVSARTNGYVRRSLVDIGDRVTEGQLLAEIDTPEIDQQLLQARQELEGSRLEVKQAEQNVNRAQQDVAQARTNLEQATAGVKQTKTNRELARVTLTRSKNLVAQGIVPRQETDERQAEFDVREAGVGVSEANARGIEASINSRLADVAGLKELVEARRAQVRAREANVARLLELQSFGHITAPFSGVITARNVETGSLITQSGGSTGGNSSDANNAGSGLYRIAKVDAIRTFVDVPQANLASVFPGLVAEVHVREFPDSKFEGKVVRTANALDSSSRTLPVEILIPNDNFRILPGMYAEVKFNLPQNGSALLIPTSSLIVRPDGTFVAVVAEDSTIHFKKIETGRDFGTEIEVLGGLDGIEKIVPTQTDALQEGARVNVAAAPEPAAAN